MTATDELLPCPFCGGEASVQTTYAHGVSEAFCLDCGAHTGYPPDGCTEAEAVAAWNTRSDYTVQAANERKAEQAENAKLRELVRDMLHWMPCKRPCQRCERYRYPEGCEFEIRRRKLGVDA